MNDKYQKTIKPDIKSAMSVSAAVIGFVSIFIGLAVTLATSVIIGAIVFLLIFLSMNIVTYFNLKSKEYRFGPKQVEMYEGFLNISQRNVAYNRITDISLERPVTQRIFGTGSIKINTAGSDIQEVIVGYIKEPEKQYREIKEISGN